jgi:hypothetical protein
MSGTYITIKVSGTESGRRHFSEISKLQLEKKDSSKLSKMLSLTKIRYRKTQLVLT